MYFTANGFIAAMDAALQKAGETIPNIGATIVYATVTFVVWIGILVSIYVAVTNVWRRTLAVQAVGYRLLVL